MIVVLRKLYEEQTEHLSLANDPVVTIGEVREEYRTITGKERDLGMIQYETLLRRLRSIGLDRNHGRAHHRCARRRSPLAFARLRAIDFAHPVCRQNWKRGCESIGQVKSKSRNER